jgi:hypothetical protein
MGKKSSDLLPVALTDLSQDFGDCARHIRASIFNGTTVLRAQRASDSRLHSEPFDAKPGVNINAEGSGLLR